MSLYLIHFTRSGGKVVYVSVSVQSGKARPSVIAASAFLSTVSGRTVGTHQSIIKMKARALLLGRPTDPGAGPMELPPVN